MLDHKFNLLLWQWANNSSTCSIHWNFTAMLFMKAGKIFLLKILIFATHDIAAHINECSAHNFTCFRNTQKCIHCKNFNMWYLSIHQPEVKSHFVTFWSNVQKLYHTQISCYTLSSLCTSTLSYSHDQDGEGEPRFSSGANQTEGSGTTCDSAGEYQVRESV